MTSHPGPDCRRSVHILMMLIKAGRIVCLNGADCPHESCRLPRRRSRHGTQAPGASSHPRPSPSYPFLTFHRRHTQQ